MNPLHLTINLMFPAACYPKSQKPLSAPDPLAGVFSNRWKASRITGATDGNPVATWNDIEGTKDATQATSNKQPLFKAVDAKLNGKSSVILDATNDGMLTALSLTIPYTIMLVAYAVDTSIQAANRTINSASTNALISINRSANAVFLFGGNIKNSTTSNGTIAHVMAIAIGAESHVYIDGVDVTGGLTGQLEDWGLIGIGAIGSNAEPANCGLGEWGVYLSVDDTKRQLVEATWKSDYGTP